MMSVEKKKWEFELVILSLVPYALPILYQVKMETAVYRADVYLVWICGLLCACSSRMKSIRHNKRLILVTGALLFYLLVIVVSRNGDENSYHSILSGISYVAIILYIRTLGALVAFDIFLLSFPAYLLQIVYGWYQLMGNGSIGMSLHGNLYNSGTYGNYVLFGIPFLLIASKSKTVPRMHRVAALLVCIGAIVLLIGTQARAAMAGLVAVFLMVYLFFRNHERSFFGMIQTVVLLVVIILSTWSQTQSKMDSLSGRLTIYKVTWNMIKDNWVLGVGPDRFRSEYNLYQLKYFQQPGVSLRQQSIADNTFEAFNIFLQVWAEYGIVGIIACAGFALWLVREINTVKNLSKFHRRLLQASGASLAGILVAALFSNPLHSSPILFSCCLSLGLVLTILADNSRRKNLVNGVDNTLYAQRRTEILHSKSTEAVT